MKRYTLVGLLAGALTLVLSGTSLGGPPSKQNGNEPAIKAFTSICAVAGYADYGLCGGDTTKFTDVTGKMNAVLTKQGTYNLGFEFGKLTPGVAYRLWSTKDAVPFGGTWTEVGVAVADEAGALKFALQTAAPDGLGFDLNTVSGDTTIVTTWWSGQWLIQNEDGKLSTAA